MLEVGIMKFRGNTPEIEVLENRLETEELKEDIINWSIELAQCYQKEETVANKLACKLDEKYDISWQVFVGKDFAGRPCAKPGTFIHFKLATYYVLVFKAK